MKCKCMISPLMKLSLPTLVLMGALVADRLAKYLLNMSHDFVGKLV